MKVMSPPAVPVLASVDWQEVQARVGVSLPSDYKSFIETYGVGLIERFMFVLHPTCANPHMSLEVQMRVRLDALREMRRAQPVTLIPWLITDNGDVGYWLVDGEPDDWSVVVHDSAIAVDEHFALSMSEFLYGVLTRQLVSSALPDDFLPPISFTLNR
jgi:hypothetical protein